METLASSDIDVLLDVLLGLFTLSAQEPSRLLEGLAPLLRRAIPSDSVVVTMGAAAVLLPHADGRVSTRHELRRTVPVPPAATVVIRLRRREAFTSRDRLLLALLAPRLRTLLRPATVAQAPAACRLTDREQEVLALVALGWDNARIADRLVVSPLTVRKHLEHVYAKLGAHNRMQAVRMTRALDARRA